jgi:hypothetical protein
MKPVKTPQREECPICMCEFVQNERVLVLPCFHKIHADECATEWFARQDFCPIDRFVITKERLI